MSTNQLFKYASFTDEIAQSMEDNLISQASVEEQMNHSLVTRAMNHINEAANIFEEIGLSVESEELTVLLEKLAKKKSKKKVEKKDKNQKEDKGTKQLKKDMKDGMIADNRDKKVKK